MGDLTDTTQSSERGLLDLSVALSTRDITAGKQFTLFVLVKNPFEKAIWIRLVDVSLPSELQLANPVLFSEKIQEKAKQKEQESEKGQTAEAKIDILQTSLEQLIKQGDNASREHYNRLIDEIGKLREELRDKDQANLFIKGDTSVGNLRIISSLSNVFLGGEQEEGGELSVGDIELYDPSVLQEEKARSGRVTLLGPLESNCALQSGSTSVYTAVLNVKRPFLFTPSQYRLQFNVLYSFSPKKNQRVNGVDEQNESMFVNTISHELFIRPSVGSMIIGGAAGGLVGSISRILQTNPVGDLLNFSSADYLGFLVSIILAVILSCISIVFVARKSDAQSFISVEDFWGGLLIGFLVAYSGTAFFGQLTGFEFDPGSSTITTPNAAPTITPD